MAIPSRNASQHPQVPPAAQDHSSPHRDSPNSQTMTMLSNETRTAGPVDADDLFMRLSVPELNVYERRTRTDIENKKQELRMMVGERYRDLIGAADCIVRMKETAFAVQDNIGKMRNSCDIHSLKRTVAAKTKKAQSGAMDDMKKSLYTSAAQIKLLADVPEQIWRNMENSSYLTASRLYLISKAIYKNLSAGMEEHESQSVKVKETFPVVGRQWDAVRHFKAQILQKSTQHLKWARLTDQELIETICAVMLLDDVTTKDMFKLVLSQRHAAISEALEGKGEDVGDQIVQAISILKATLFHIGHVFITPEQGKSSPLERHLTSLQQTFAAPTSQDDSTLILQPPTPAASVIPKLYPNTPNIHLLVRYLPESVQNFTPFIHLEGARASFSQQEVYQGVKLWMNDVVTMFSTAFERLLQQVQTSAALVAIRSNVWSALQADEYAMVSKAKKSQWVEICRFLLGEPLSIWNSILRSGFSKTLQDIIVFSLEELSHQPERMLRPRLGDLDNMDDTNHDVGRFIWNDLGATKRAALPSSTEPLIQRIHEYVAGKTELVAEATEAFESKLLAIRTDQEQALHFDRDAVFGSLAGGTDVQEDEIDSHESLDLFGARADTQELLNFYQRRCVDCITAFTLSLEQLVQEAVRKPEKARNTIPAMDRALTIGRIASVVSSRGSVLQRALLQPSQSSGSSNFAQARLSKANVDAQVQDLIKGLLRVYMVSHEAWMESMEWTLTKGLRHYFKESSWTDLATLAWEPIPSAGGAGGGVDAKTLLPFHSSTRLMSALHQMIQEMHRVGTGFMRPELILVLANKLAKVTYKAAEEFLQEDSSQRVGFSEKGALQLLFDVKVLNLVFQTTLQKDTALAQLSRSVVESIKQHIDPINLAVFDKPLDVNAERQYSRVNVMLGLLVQLNPVESKRKVNVMEKSPHVFAMAPLTARFTLLPIGQKMTSGRTI